jgi:hypothetical protein
VISRRAKPHSYTQVFARLGNFAAYFLIAPMSLINDRSVTQTPHVQSTGLSTAAVDNAVTFRQSDSGQHGK